VEDTFIAATFENYGLGVVASVPERKHSVQCRTPILTFFVNELESSVLALLYLSF